MSNYNENLKLRDANVNLIYRQFTRGFQPCWYCVIHLENTGKSTKYANRRLNLNDEVIDDVLELKKKLYRKIYGRKWQRNSRRARSIWTLEYGKLSTPHINLIMEALPSRYNSIEQLNLLLDFELPRLLRCLPRRPKTCHVQQVTNKKQLIKYICKEVKVTDMWTIPNTGNAIVLHELNDYDQDLYNENYAN